MYTLHHDRVSTSRMVLPTWGESADADDKHVTPPFSAPGSSAGTEPGDIDQLGSITTPNDLITTLPVSYSPASSMAAEVEPIWKPSRGGDVSAVGATGGAPKSRWTKGIAKMANIMTHATNMMQKSTTVAER
jgi:hypothetical protein